MYNQGKGEENRRLSSSKHLIQYQTIQSNQIYLNSSNASFYDNGFYKSNVTFYLSNLIQSQKNTIELRVSLVNAQIPQSYYLINSTNNKFIVNGTAYYFPSGNYNVNSFINTWYSLMGTTWTLSFNTITNLLTFTNSSNFTLSDDVNSIFPIIGFSKGQSYGGSNSITSPYPVNFIGIQRLLISCPQFNLNSKTSIDNAFSNVICSVPASSIQNGLIYYVNLTNFKSIFKNSNLDKIQIQITDDQKNFINFNNQDWSITLQIDMINEIIQDLSTLEDIYEEFTEY